MAGATLVRASGCGAFALTHTGQSAACCQHPVSAHRHKHRKAERALTLFLNDNRVVDCTHASLQRYVCMVTVLPHAGTLTPRAHDQPGSEVISTRACDFPTPPSHSAVFRIPAPCIICTPPSSAPFPCILPMHPPPIELCCDCHPSLLVLHARIPHAHTLTHTHTHA